jgi:hypothetical protein
MAIIDTYGELSDAQALSAIGGPASALSTHVIYWPLSDKSGGVAQNQYLNITCNTTATSVGSTATLTILVYRHSTATVNSGTVIYQTPAFAISGTALTAYDGKTNGTILCMPLPDNVDEDAYFGLYYTVGTQAFTAGAIDAWVGPPMQSRYDSQVATSNV